MQRESRMFKKENQTLTVDQVSSRIQALLVSDQVLQSLNVIGEIIDFKRHSSGHVYFSIGGGISKISGVMFRSETRNLPSWPKVGDEVIVQGRIAVYPARSTYQIYARNIIPVGLGASARAKEEIRKKLEEEGLFDPRSKRTIPCYPSSVAVVTSPTGAAVKDVIKVASQRSPFCSITVVPTLVQGLDASADIIRALGRARKIPHIQALLLVRGGGSRDDLNPFDDEFVVRAIRSVPVPVITGLGHEIDLTLCDLAADMSAPTPSAAAERLLPDRREISGMLDNDLYRIRIPIVKKIEYHRNNLERLAASSEHSLENILSLESLKVDDLQQKQISAFGRRLNDAAMQLSSLSSSLNALSPLSVLERGFITCQSTKGNRVISSVSKLAVKSLCILHFKDGTATVEVEDVSP